MFSDIGSGASLVGLVISLLGLGFAIWQLMKVKSTADAARKAAEEARDHFKRELTAVELTRLNGRINHLKEMHRSGHRRRILDHYQFVKESLRDIYRQYPVLSKQQKAAIIRSVAVITAMEFRVETLPDNIEAAVAAELNAELNEMQSSLLVELQAGEV